MENGVRSVMVAPQAQEAIVEQKKDKHWQLRPHQFKTGGKPGPGRPKGSKNFAKTLNRCQNKLAKAYVKHALEGSATLLQDARKVLAPIDSDAGASAPVVFAFLSDDGDGNPCRPVTDQSQAPLQLAAPASDASENV